MERQINTPTPESHAPLLVDSDDRIELLLDYAACYEKRGVADTWGATPSSISQSLASQKELFHKFALRYVVPSHLVGTNESIKYHMEQKFIDRFVNRCVANDENYRRALSPHPFAEDDQEKHEKLLKVEQNALIGTASPAELLALQSIHQLGAIELASLTHPYGANIEYLDDMRSTIANTIRLFGGEVYQEPEVKFSISDVINEGAYENIPPEQYEVLSKAEKIAQRNTLGDVVGLLMTRKRTIGILPDGTVIRERTSFVLTKESGLLSEEILALLSETPSCDHWGREAIHGIDGLDCAITGLLNNDHDILQYTKVIPVSTTTYSFNADRVKEINQTYQDITATDSAADGGHMVHDKLRYFAASELRKAGIDGMNGKPMRKDYIDINGMAFFMPDSPTESSEDEYGTSNEYF